ncbi:MAG: hypothetical protein JJU29_06050 [Verrucomicrobia bacterium]|nr:hypothetical protein [Verrucomicrobiota bacterium]MCH8511844.1 hypothetical protein [Kiritimatiellia bacterium]
MQSQAPTFQFDPRRISFSSPGSFLAIAEPPYRFHTQGPLKDLPIRSGLFLRSVHGRSNPPEIFRLALFPDTGTETVSATPDTLRMENGRGGLVEICFETVTRLRIRCTGTGLQLVREEWRPFDHIVPRRDGTWEINSYQNRINLGVQALRGEIRVDAPWERVRCTSMTVDLLCPEDGPGEFLIEEFDRVWTPENEHPTFEDCQATQQKAWQTWRALFPVPAEPTMNAAADLAAYLNASCIAGPSGHLLRPAMLMSKYKMRNYWTWDHCFNVLAHWPAQPELALDQLLLAFDHQSPEGGMPCSLNDETLFWHNAKPPVHGWTLTRMRKQLDLPREVLADLYPKLCAWTDWWFKHRDDDKDGLPQADHGNDTGWDNASVFHCGPGVNTPDIPAYLVLQMHSCADLARDLGHTEESESWRARAVTLLMRMIEVLWDTERNQFISRKVIDGTVAPGDSLINFMPMVLGEHLPVDMAKAMVAAIMEEGRFLTPHGLATESLDSPYYAAEGYWRGPIWAPVLLLIVDGMKSAGFAEEAREISRRFLQLCARSGFPENFQAETGASLRDPTYTWTASVFLVLLAEEMRRAASLECV